MRTLAVFALTIALVPIVWFVIEVDIWIGMSLNWIFQLIFVSLGITVGWASFIIRRHWITFVVPSIYVLFIVILPYIEFSAVKPALRGMNEISPGMTQSKVRAVFNHHFPKNGKFNQPEFRELQENDLSFVVDPNEGCCDAATIHIKFANGKTVSAEFHSD